MNMTECVNGCMATSESVPMHRDPEWLRRRADEGWTQEEMAEEAGVTQPAINAAMSDHNVESVRGVLTEGELLDEIARVASEVGGRPSTEDFRRNSDLVHYRTVTRRFGDWETALKRAELDCA